MNANLNLEALDNARWVDMPLKSILSLLYFCTLGGARGVMIIVVGHGHGDTSSNPGRD